MLRGDRHMLFRAELIKPDVMGTKLKDLGEALRLIDSNEQEFRLTIEHELKQHADFLAQEKQEKLEQIKNKLESEKKSYQQLNESKYKDDSKAPHLTETQRNRLRATLQEKLKQYETFTIRKYEQLSKQLAEQIDLSKKKFLEEQQNKINDEISQNAIKREKIINELGCFLVPDKDYTLDNYMEELYDTVKEIDEKIAESARSINSDLGKLVLDEYKKMDIYLYNTINNLAQKYLLYKSDELKLALVLSLSKLTNYRLDESLRLADRIVANLSAQVISKEKNRISFELISQDIEKELNLNSGENRFKDVLSAIKETCGKFTARAEYLFTCFNHAKKQEYGNKLSSIASDNLIDQENARLYLQERTLDYLIKHIDPKKFYLTFVNLGIEAMQAKIRDREDNHSLNDFNIHHDQVLKELNDELNQIYDNFFIENKISPIVKEKLNHAEIQKMFFQMLTHGYMKHEPDNFYTLRNNLPSAEILAELEADCEKQKLLFPKPASKPTQMQEPETVLTPKDKSIEMGKLFINLFKKEKLTQFKYFLNIKKPTLDVLQQVKSQLRGENGSEAYLQAIDDALQRFSLSNGNYGLFNKSDAKPVAKIVSSSVVKAAISPINST